MKLVQTEYGMSEDEETWMHYKDIYAEDKQGLLIVYGT